MSDGERLYRLLPAIYRIRDSAEGEPLRALLAVIEAELETLEADIEGLYENAFIETCDEWVVPYIGDLLGARPLHDVAGAFSLRAYVANTLRYRRRKGTATVLEQLARDVTGWPARAVEFFQWLGTSQHLNHVRPRNLRSPDLRNTTELERIGTAFDTASYTAEARRIETYHGRYNIPNLGLFVWRLQAYAVNRSSARAIAEPPDGRYTFDPPDRDVPLFNRPQTETEHPAEDVNVPGALRRRALYDDLEAYRQALVRGETPRSRYFGAQPVLRVFIDEQFDDGEPIAVPPEEILICNLSDWDLGDWQRPPVSKTYTPQTGEPIELPISVAVDPALGRLAFPVGKEPQTLQVSFAYGFSADLGGGPYDRRDSLARALDRAVTWQVGVAQSPDRQPVGGETLFASLAEAVRAWNQQPAGTVGVIAVLDSYSYRGDLTGADAIEIPEGSRLLLVAADWPKTDLETGGQERRVGQLNPDGLRPHLRGTVSVRGTAPGESAAAGELILNGLLIEGELRVLAGNLGGLRLDHCTLVPGFNGLSVNASVNPGSQNDRLRVSVTRSILAGISLPDSVPALHVEDSILDRPGGLAVAAPGVTAWIDASTLLGGVETRELQASETIFTAPVVAERRQSGCVRFSYLAEGSRTPRRYRCQPDLALEGVTDTAERAGIRARLAPSFTATDHGAPGYLQLGAHGPEELAAGAEDGTEMGVFKHLKQPQRIANLRAATDDYLPFGLAAGVFFVT